MILKLTLASGDVCEIPFDTTSALTVTTVTTVDGQQVESAEAHAEIVGIELVESPPVPEPVIETLTGEQAAAQTGETTADVPPTPDTFVEPGIGDTSDTPVDEAPVEVGTHDEAVAAAQAAVDVAASGAADDFAGHIAKAIADVDAALAVYPDSTDLQDAKAQLELLQPAGA